MSDLRPPPAFQFYAADVLANEEFKLLTLEERGLWITMLAQCWVNNSVPCDARDLAKVLGLEVVEVARLLPAVLKFFQSDGRRLGSSELASMKANYAARREERARTGRKGAEKRWESNSSASSAKPKAKPIAKPSREGASAPERRKGEDSRGDGSGADWRQDPVVTSEDLDTSGFHEFADLDDPTIPVRAGTPHDR